MARYLITGVAGTGKSSAAKELSKRGYNAYDTEEGFSYYIEKSSGEKCAYPKHPSQKWYNEHERVFDEDVLKNLFKKHAGEDIFIATITANQSKYYGDFDKIFLLTTDENTIKHRLETRIGNDFGKHPLDMHRVLSRQREFEDEVKSQDAVVIDSSGPINETVDKILAHTA